MSNEKSELILEHQLYREDLAFYIEKGDAKGAIRHLNSLKKEVLHRVLLVSGFTISGEYKSWIGFNQGRIIEACKDKCLPIHKNGIRVELDVSEEVQIDTFQNATFQSVNDKIACSIAVFPRFPNYLSNQEEVADFLKKEFLLLMRAGWKFEIQIGETANGV